MELLEVQLTTAEGQVAVFTFTVEKLNDLAPQLHALAKVGLFEVCVRDYGMSVWSVIDGEPCDCEECDNGWTRTEHKDISFEHCGRPAEWHGEQVVCSKCQEVMPEN